MKWVKRIVIGLLILELGLLSFDTYKYCTKGLSKTNTNGRLIAEIDNNIHFSKWATE